MRISLIVAVSDNHVIGRENDLPWRLPRDLKRFRSVTMGHHLLVGRKTFEAIGRPLPGRTLVVLSRHERELPAGVVPAGSLKAALELARAAGETEAFIGGGEELYRQALPLTERIYLTRVHAAVSGDAHFRRPPAADWRQTAREHYPVSDENEVPLTFFVLEKRA